MGMAKKVLITGAAGFIGSHVTEALVRAGHEVRAFIRYTGRDDRGHLESLEPEVRRSVEIARGDLRDAEAVRHAVQGREWILHLGALIAIPYSYQNPHEFVQTNVMGTAHLLDAARGSSVLERLVLTSSSEVYGTARVVPIDEGHPLQGQSPYAATKIGADALGLSYHLAFDLPVAILRPFNTYGPRQSARAIIPTIISQALTRPFLELGSLEPRRDLTFVTDTAQGFLAIASCPGAVGEVINIGSGHDHTIGELVEKIGHILGRRLEVRTDPRRVRPAASEVGRLLAGTEKAKKLMGWQPTTSLEEGLRATIEYVRTHSEQYRPDHYAT
jgi:dTDP-glucose 4,6-dehydratase